MALQPVRVQTNSTQSITANPTVKNAAAASVAGNMYIVLAQWLGVTGDNPTAVSDTAGNTYKQAPGSPQFDSGSNTGEAVWYCTGIKASAINTNTVTVTSSSTDIEIVLLEFSNAVGLDIAAANFVVQASGQTTDSATVTQHFLNEEMVAYESDSSAGASGAGTGWTQDSGFPTSFGSMLEYQAETTTGSRTATVPMASATGGGMLVVFGVVPGMAMWDDPTPRPPPPPYTRNTLKTASQQDIAVLARITAAAATSDLAAWADVQTQRPPPRRPVIFDDIPQVDTKPLPGVGPNQDDIRPIVHRQRHPYDPQEWMPYDATKPLLPVAPFQDDVAAQVYRKRPPFDPQEWPAIDATRPLPPIAPLQDDIVPDVYRQRHPFDPQEWPAFDATKPLPGVGPFQEDPTPRRPVRPIPEEPRAMAAIVVTSLPSGGWLDEAPYRPALRPRMPVDDAPLKDVTVVVLPSAGWHYDDSRRPPPLRHRPRDDVPFHAVTVVSLTSLGWAGEDRGPAPRRPPRLDPELFQALVAPVNSIAWLAEAAAGAPRRGPGAPAPDPGTVLALPLKAIVWSDDPTPPRRDVRRLEEPLIAPRQTVGLLKLLDDPPIPPRRWPPRMPIDDAPLKDATIVVLPSLGWLEEPPWKPQLIRARIALEDEQLALAVSLLPGAFADVRLTLYPIADASVRFEPTVRILGDTAIAFCYLFRPGSFVALEPDGSSLTATGRSPSGVTTVLGVSRVSAGVYWAPVQLTATGDWVVRFQGTVGGLPLLVENVCHCRAPAF